MFGNLVLVKIFTKHTTLKASLHKYSLAIEKFEYCIGRNLEITLIGRLSSNQTYQSCLLLMIILTSVSFVLGLEG